MGESENKMEKRKEKECEIQNYLFYNVIQNYITNVLPCYHQSEKINSINIIIFEKNEFEKFELVEIIFSNIVIFEKMNSRILILV